MKKIEPNLRAIKLLASIHRIGGLLQAASIEGMSQSAASHAVRTLERMFGAQLFARGSGPMQLSLAGQSILPHVHQILQSLDGIEQELAAEPGLRTGSLRIAAVPSLASTILPPLMKEFSRQVPEVKVVLHEGSDPEVTEWVRQGLCQCGFASTSDLRVQTLGRDEWKVLVPHREWESLTEVKLSQLGRRPFLLSGGGCEAAITALFTQQRLTLPPHTLVRGMDTLQAMVAAGLGIAIVPELCLRRMPKGTKALSLLPRRFRRLSLLLPAKTIASPGLDLWLQTVRARFKDLCRNPVRAQRTQ